MATAPPAATDVAKTAVLLELLVSAHLPSLPHSQIRDNADKGIKPGYSGSSYFKDNSYSESFQ